jgi:C-terminal processing protease CtpA/Prc
MRHNLLLLLTITVLFAGCNKDKEKTVSDINGWVYGSMQSKYLWTAQLPPLSAEDRLLPTAEYFETLRFRVNTAVPYDKDNYGDRFSYVEHEASTRAGGVYAEKEHGTGISYYYTIFTDDQDNVIYAESSHVPKNSPAWNAGLRRGDVFTTISGRAMPMPSSDCVELLQQNNVTLTIVYPVDRARTITISASDYYDDPVVLDTVYNRSSKVGYLVYKHFTAGDNNMFTANLQKAFDKFKSEGVRKLILDLRSNGGGELDTSIDLAGMMAPASRLGQPFLYLERNTNFGDPDNFDVRNYPTDASHNIDMTDLYVLTTTNTASASELIIHGFQAEEGVNVYVLGNGKTTGKNLGSRDFTDSGYPNWLIRIITLRIYDKNKVSGYEEGIAPDVSISDLVSKKWDWGGDPAFSGYTYVRVYEPFGDTENEPMLRRALEMIDGSASTYSAPESDSDGLRAVSMERPRALTEGRTVVR